MEGAGLGVASDNCCLLMKFVSLLTLDRGRPWVRSGCCCHLPLMTGFVMFVHQLSSSSSN